MKIKTAYKQTEIGEIPEDWNSVPLSTITKKITKGIFDLGPEYYVAKGIPYIRISDIRNNRIVLDPGKFISKEKNKEFPTTQLQPGDIVLSKLASARFESQIAIIPDSIPICNLSQSLIGIKLDHTQIDSSYLLYFLKHKKTSDFLISRSTGTSQKWIRLNVMRDLCIPLPKLDIQQKIAGILSTAGDAIQKTDQIIQKTQLLKQGLMNQMLTRGINHTKFKQTEIGEIPGDWDLVKLGDETIAEIILGQSPPSSTYNKNSEGLPFLQGNADFGDIYPNPTTYTTNPIKISLKNDVLISVRAPVGEVNLSPFKCCMGRGLSAIRTNPKKLLNLFAFYAMKNSVTKLRALSSGSTFKAITKSDLDNFLIQIPNIYEQQKIVNILSTVEEKLDFETQRKNYLKQVRQGLMNDLLTGKKRVRRVTQ